MARGSDSVLWCYETLPLAGFNGDVNGFRSCVGSTDLEDRTWIAGDYDTMADILLDAFLARYCCSLPRSNPPKTEHRDRFERMPERRPQRACSNPRRILARDG